MSTMFDTLTTDQLDRLVRRDVDLKVAPPPTISAGLFIATDVKTGHVGVARTARLALEKLEARDRSGK